MADPTTKAELLAQMRAAQDAAETTIARVPPEKFAEPGVNGDWSAKDEIAHLTFWNGKLLNRLAAAAAGSAPDADAMPTSDAQIDAWNARCFAAHRDQPLDAVLAEFRDGYAAVEGAVNGLSDADLFDPHRFAWTRGGPLWRSVAENITEHYPEHCERIAQWLAAQSVEGMQ